MRKYHCHNCGRQIDNPETGMKVQVRNTAFHVVVCKYCSTEHQFTEVCDELQCHATQR